MTRILHVGIGNLGPGGVSTYVGMVAQGQRARGHDVSVSELWPLPDVGSSAPTILHDIGSLDGLVRDLRPDTIHLHSLLPSYEVVGASSVLTAHDHLPHCPSGTRYLVGSETACTRRFGALECGVGNYVDRCGSRLPSSFVRRYRLTRAADGFQGHWIAPSAYSRSRMVERGLPPERVHCVPNPGPRPIRPAPHAPGSGRFLFMGRLVSNKGGSVAISALARTEERIRLVVAGDGPFRGAMEDLAARSGVAHRVEFVGWRSSNEIADLLDSCDGLLVPSLWPEPFGLVVLEAFSRGCPVIASATGGIVDLVRNGETGFLVPPGDPAALAQAMDRALGDQTHCRAIARNAFDDLESKFSLDRHLDRLEEIYGLASSGTDQPRTTPRPESKNPSVVPSSKPSPSRRIVFLYTAGIDLPAEQKSGTDLAVRDIAEELSMRWETLRVGVPERGFPFHRRHVGAVKLGAPSMMVDRMSGCPDARGILRPGDLAVLADDYAGLALRMGWDRSVLVRHNALHHSYATGIVDSFQSRLQHRYNAWLARRFDSWSTRAALAVLAPSGTTEILLRKLVPDAKIQPWHPRIPRLPGGPLPVLRDSGTLIGTFFANYRYAPNFEALKFICEKLAPAVREKNVRFRLAGPALQERASELVVPENVELAGFQPDLIGFCQSCDFGILPIFHGEGILLKTLTLLGYGMPMVATSKSCGGIGIQDGVHAFVAEDVATMARSIEALRDVGTRRRMSRAAWDAAAAFSFSSGIVEAIESILHGDPGPAAVGSDP